MKYYLAPLEGNTTYVFRTAYHRHYGGMERYFTPFIASRNLSSRERGDVLPEHNVGMTCIPQIITGRADEFLDIAASVKAFGYDTVNLNLGCPAATVVSRKRGSGMLSDTESLKVFLDEIYTKCDMKISVKTRIGIESTSEWTKILDVFEMFPLEELIIHPRLQKQGYGGQVHFDAMQEAYERNLPFPVCFNGDLLYINEEAAGYGSLSYAKELLPQMDTAMIGRGIFRYPGMVAEAGSEPSLDRLKAFHSELLSGYIKIMSGDANTLFKMKDLWTFLSQSFEDSDKYLKKIRKSSRLSEYEVVVNSLFRECAYIPTRRDI